MEVSIVVGRYLLETFMKINEGQFGWLMLGFCVALGLLRGLIIHLFALSHTSIGYAALGGAMFGSGIVGLRAFVWRQVRSGRYRWFQRP